MKQPPAPKSKPDPKDVLSSFTFDEDELEAFAAKIIQRQLKAKAKKASANPKKASANTELARMNRKLKEFDQTKARLKNLDLSNWIPTKLVLKVTQQTCEACGQITIFTQNTDSLMLHYKHKQSSMVWITKAPIQIRPGLPREYETTYSRVAQCAHCFQPSNPAQPELPLIGGY